MTVNDLVIERTKDLELVRQVMTHPKIWPYISDDYSPPREQFRPIDHDSVWYVTARDRAAGNELLVVWMVHPHNTVCWEVHTAVLPSAWGERGLMATRMAQLWLFRNSPCRRIVTNVPVTNRLALRFALKSGMQIYGVNERSFMKDGVLINQVCLGVSSPDATSHPSELPEGEMVCQPQ